MWFVFALATFLAWGTADLFYKKGTGEETYSHLRTTIAVGFVFGAVAVGTMLVRDISYDFVNLLIYLPVSAMYILSMAVGYFGLRYLELSVSSPVQNASGAVSCLILMIALQQMPTWLEGVAVLLITVGVVMLGVFEKQKDNAPALESDKKYRIGFVAFFMPIIYCVLDSLGTALDGIYLDDFSATPLRGVTEDTFEDVANISYMLTFFLVALLLCVYLFVWKKEPVRASGQPFRLAAAGCEAVGQFTYVYAMSGGGVVAAPMIASYCVMSVLLARVFLKERLALKQYAVICLVFAGILLLGVSEGMAQ